ncbi:MAG: EVE domain-containing protein [Xanthomonadales bacterium]|jgi:predicted RNA-binding protein with PUA-like domain|nr:EVE domain-containing protein [Xanthomonadales bacterium]
MGYWLMKSEPDAYGIDDLERDGREPWDGIRNYQVRNMIRDDMQVGDEALFYHSRVKEPAAVGIMRIVSDAYPDPTQFDANSKYFDARSDPDNPRWLLRDVEFIRRLERPVTLKELKAHPGLGEFQLTKKGNRLSIFPVTKDQWDTIVALAKNEPVS